MLSAMDAVFTPAEVAQTLKVAEPDALGLIVRGELGAFELTPGEYRVTATDLRRFINVRRADFRPPRTRENSFLKRLPRHDGSHDGLARGQAADPEPGQ